MTSSTLTPVAVPLLRLLVDASAALSGVAESDASCTATTVAGGAVGLLGVFAAARLMLLCG